MYGEGTSTNPVHSGKTGLGGEGSHLESARDTTTGTGVGGSTVGSTSTTHPTSTTTTGTTTTSTTTTGTGLGSSAVGNTVNQGAAPTTAGPHTTDLGNKMDPKVDSNLDGSRTMGNTAGIGSTGTSNLPGTSTSQSTNPYSAKDVDPRIGGNNTSTTSGLDTGRTAAATGPSGGQSSLTGNNDHHLGRDAAAVGTAGAVGEGIHHHPENERQNVGTTGTGLGTHGTNLGERERERENLGTSGAGYTGTTPSGAGSSYYGAPAGTAISGPHTTMIANALDPHVNKSSAPIENAREHDPVKGGGAEAADQAHGASRTGRDAALGAGAVGLAEHEHRHHDHQTGTGIGSGTGVGSTTGTTGTTGHHLGRDAAVGAGGVGLAEHEHRKHEHGTGLTGTRVGNTTGSDSTIETHKPSLLEKLNPFSKSDNTSSTGTSGTDHHLGRDAAVGAGGVGLAEHEHRKHEHGTGLPATGSTGSYATTDTAGQTIGMRNRDAYVDPAARDTPGFVSSATQPGHPTHGERDMRAGDHHYGRDAAALGAAGVGAHELARHDGAATTGTGIGGTSGLSEHERLKLEAARNQPGNDYGSGVYSGNTTTGTGRDHHLGRDAAGAGVVGAGAYEAEQHHKHDKDLTAAEREAKREHKHEAKEAKHEHHEEKKHHGLLSFLHRDKNKKYTKEEEDEFDRQEREHNSHKGRDAALGSAAVGGAAYEADKHHHGHHHTASADADTMKPLPVAPGNHGIGTGEGTQNALVMDRKRGEGYDTTDTTGTGHHLGRDAAVVGGAGALGAHEHGRVDESHIPEADRPVGTTLGDKLHGVERNRGINAPGWDEGLG